MAFEHPTQARMRAIAEDLGLNLPDDIIAKMHGFLTPFVEAYNLVGQLPEDLPEVKYDRGPWTRPEGDANRYGAWTVKVSIPGSGKGRLKGKTCAIKDSICIAEVPMANGSTLLEGYIPEVDATVVTRLLDQGATITGKSQCEYFCFSGGSRTSATGPVDNPRNPGYTPGGSSTGSAALVVAGEVDFAMGGDQAGSIRIPASYSGIVGIKPTFGLVPYTGIAGIEYSIDHTGPLTANVADNALCLEVLAGPDGYDSRSPGEQAGDYTGSLGRSADGLKIGIVGEGFGLRDSEPDVDEIVRRAARRFEPLGATVSEVSVPWHSHGLAIWAAISTEGAMDTMLAGNGFGHGPEGLYLPSMIKAMSAWHDRADEFPWTLATNFVLAKYAEQEYGGRYYARGQNLRRRLRAEYDAALKEFDLLLMPTTRMKTTPIPGPEADYLEVMKHSWEMIANTCPFNVTGHPAISIPCGMSDARPVGLMLIARHWNESLLYQAGHALEQSGDWRKWGV